MNTFLVQVGKGGGYSTIMKKGSYTNEHWRGRAESDKSRRRSEYIYNRDHGIVEPGDQFVVYCASRVPEKTHRQRLAFSVIVGKVSDDRATFEVGKPQCFSNPLELKDIRNYIEQGKLDECFGNCGREGFNITKLEPTAVQQLFDLVEP